MNKKEAEKYISIITILKSSNRGRLRIVIIQDDCAVDSQFRGRRGVHKIDFSKLIKKRPLNLVYANCWALEKCG